MGNELTVRSAGEIAESNPQELVSLALKEHADPKTLEKLMDLQERWEANRARKAFVKAMTAFKQEAPAVLKKNDTVDFTTAKGRTNYNYANLGSIVQEITAVLGKHDLSASWETKQDGSNVTVTCHITHAAGHRESVTLTGPADDSGNKNRIQAVGSTVTYLQRYTLLAALGLATGDDDDGQGGKPYTSGKPPVSQPQAKSASAPAEDLQLVTGVLGKVTTKSGQGKKGPWTGTYATLAGDEAVYSTFSTELGPQVQALEGQKVSVSYKDDGKYKTIVSIESAEELADEAF